MRERPILFTAAMVRSLLLGTKTQTRRVAKGFNYVSSGGAPLNMKENDIQPVPCPYGQPGDRLWVRETWAYFDPDGSGEDYDSDHNDDGKAGPCGVYRAEMLQDGHPLRDYWRRRIAYKATFAEQKYGMGPVGPSKWRPSIHMPRWASRITLEVTGVRVERLLDISEADAIAEGIERADDFFGCPCWKCYGEDADVVAPDDPIGSYRSLWESINGPGSWDANPWVWVVEFRRA